MKDIELTPNGDGTYDWRFVGGDVSTVNGVASLRNSIIHALRLKYGELGQELYSMKGSMLHTFGKMKGSSTNMDYLRETIVASIKELEGVYDARVTVESNGIDKIISNITIIKENGDEVIIGAI